MKQQHLNIAFFGTILLFVMFLVFLTYDPALHSTNPLLNALVHNHVLLMFIMGVLATAFGYYSSRQLQGEVRFQEHRVQQVQDTFMNLLPKEDKKILSHLFQHTSQTQAQITAATQLSRVQVHRAVQRLKGQGLILVEAKGKARYVTLLPSLKP